MIFDRLENIKQYENVHAGVTKALQAMANYTPENYQTGRVELDGDNVFLSCNQYETITLENAKVEAHRKYIDVMYMVEGEEFIYVKPTCMLKNIKSEYDSSIDALLATRDDDAIPIRLTAGCFVVLFPQDAHAPACCVDCPISVKKIIGKVRI